MPQTEPSLGRPRAPKRAESAGPERTSRGFAYRLSYLRSLLVTNNLIYFCTAVMATIALGGSVFDAHGRWQHACLRFWARLVLAASGVRVRVEGLEQLNSGETVIFCANHPSAMDIPILIASLPFQFRFLAKRELFQLPFLGWYLRRAGHIAVERGRPREAMRSFEEAAVRVRQGASVVLFPEGGRSRRAGELLPFKNGSFYLAIHAGVPIVPITLNGTRATHEPDTYHVRAGQTEVIIHPPIDTRGLTLHDVHNLSERVRETILSRFLPALKEEVLSGD